MRFTRIDRAMRRAGRTTKSLGSDVADFAKRNREMLVATGVCAAVAIPTGVIAAKAPALAVGACALISVVYGIGVAIGVADVATKELGIRKPVAA